MGIKRVNKMEKAMEQLKKAGWSAYYSGGNIAISTSIPETDGLVIEKLLDFPRRDMSYQVSRVVLCFYDD